MDIGAGGVDAGEHRIDGLAALILDDTAASQAGEKDDAVVLPDDLLPGVGVAQVSLRSALRTGGVAMVVVLILVQVVEQLDRVAMAVLAPDIQTLVARERRGARRDRWRVGRAVRDRCDPRGHPR